MKERYLLAVESVEKEKDRLKALQLDAGMKAVDSYLLNECRPSLLGGTEDSTNQKVLSDERVSAAEKVLKVDYHRCEFSV